MPDTPAHAASSAASPSREGFGRRRFVAACAALAPLLAACAGPRRLQGKAPIDFPQETAIGALGLYVSNESVGSFQPMNINFGIMPQLGYRVKGKRNKNAELSKRSLEKIGTLQEEVLAK